ncbi:3-oxoacyl-[acyl-carrier-protein] synthase-3 [Symbiobacterium terraclitae]|uniref:3-oxoacyl-[acyl-carrier-protein] synthase-3 n=1 Tax=Symbiobacterium terraclitae TaxID=557451 RepID=A0ABS4JQK2_9FIRM|nr:3-oxoacyl-ACP synthase [Symbiobacterium terraclitae]MBP2017797.1 3-oxoacyl-[acyl-carrier-protein] synthase-3 [Symbiobacterium terraclitae]
MTKTQPHVGVVSTGIYIPDRFMTAEEIAARSGVPLDVVKRKMGILRKPLPGPDDGTAAMGIRAAQQCIERAGIDPESIDLVIYIGEEYKEYLLWTAGIKTAHAVGATRAWAFDTQLRCGTWVLGMKLAQALMLSDEGVNTVLLAGGYRNVDYINYANPRVSFMYNLGAGGGAMLLKKNYGRNRVLGSDIIVDGSLSETVGVRGGGTLAGLHNHDDSLYQLDVFDVDGMKSRLNAVSTQRWVDVVSRACARGGYTTRDIDYLAILHMKRSAHEGLIRELGIPVERAIYLEEYGHIGQIDQILSIHLALERGLIKDGDLVVGVSAGIGYAWGATAIEWGPVGARQANDHSAG